MSKLDRIVDAVKARLEAEPARPDLSEAARERVAQRRAAVGQGSETSPNTAGPRSLARVLRAGPRPEQRSAERPAIIAECKKASPSAGLLMADLDPARQATAYARAGASAISVVTERDFFQGQPQWLGQVHEAVDLPVLRKDFIICERQLEEAALLGADAVLLIQRILEPDLLQQLLQLAEQLDLEVLLEVFADEDPAPAVASGAHIIGVNARDLGTFEMHLGRVAELAAAIPDDRLKVAESGIKDPETLWHLYDAGYDAFLIGEHLVRSGDPGASLESLLTRPGA